ncbi:hypothetical protein [Bosea sp. Root483D1]|uniref:hypothetical protein n=1 Tax=Bosea sp. Root483D1 TaxID=1736544 RepID=UPI0012E347BB|nr:hypothetical protein [Bosea sp. Root483D1]
MQKYAGNELRAFDDDIPASGLADSGSQGNPVQSFAKLLPDHDNGVGEGSGPEAGHSGPESLPAGRSQPRSASCFS